MLKELAGSAPTKAETFQWVNLMRGDTMFMSLTDHKYLGTKPNAPGQVAANTTGPTPARKRGVCFKWKVVDCMLPQLLNSNPKDEPAYFNETASI